MNCPHCNVHGQVEGRNCSRCHRMIESVSSVEDTTTSDILSTVIAAEVISSAFDSSPSVDSSPSSDFSGFGGGDTGGGGAGGDF